MRDQNNQLSKDSIRQRMLQHAVNFWSVRAVDELDPVVLVLIEGLCSEIYTVQNELLDSNTRILEKIANLLTPSVFIYPRPAHAIAKMDILEPTLFINKHTELYAKNLSQNFEIDYLTFVPVTDVRLIDGKIKYLICERRLYKTDENGGKRAISQAEILDERINQTCWVGLQIDNEVETLKDVSLYLDFPQSDKKYEKYSLIPYSKWSYAGKAI